MDLRISRHAAWLGAGLALSGCSPTGRLAVSPVVPPPLPQPLYNAGAATPRVSGPLDLPETLPTVAQSTASPIVIASTSRSNGGGAGDVSLDFADTDIREVVAQILGNTLHVNYTIDPAVHGTATLRTVTPLSNVQLVPVLQSLLAQNAATLVQSGGVYRVLPAAAAAGLAGGPGTAGGMFVPLRYASAEDLVKALQPYLAGAGKLVAVPSSNAIVISGEPGQRDALADMIRAFDVDELAGQSYALFPVDSGDATEFATALQTAFRAQQGGQLATQIRVVPMTRVNAVLLIASQPRYLADARRVFAVVERGRRATTRSWHVYYLQNSTSNDIAYVLQEAFTPQNVTAQPSATASGTQGGISGQSGGIAGIAGLGGNGSSSGSSAGGGLGSSGGAGSSSGSSGGLGMALGNSAPPSTGGQGSPAAASSSSAASNPLLGGLSTSDSGTGGEDANAMRIISNAQNNAVLVYATANEADAVEAMLRKIDILPLQVRVDAVIAEVTLNDNLAYGTQFYFQHHALTGGLANGASLLTSAATAVAGTLPGFVLNTQGSGVDVVLDALQAVTTVKVLSSPELLVLDNETAQLQVGNLVPYLSASAQSTLTTGAPIVSSIDYRETGVITQVTPRVNSGGLVTLDIAQEVSGVVQGAQSSGASGSTINSPTFTERAVKSRIVVQDGQTVGLAGLITDNVSTGNSGIPFLKDVPILGFLAGSQSNVRARTELLVLITPHVLHDQRDARALTEDLREQLPRAALAPYELQETPPTGSSDPSARLGRSKARGSAPGPR